MECHSSLSATAAAPTTTSIHPTTVSPGGCAGEADEGMGSFIDQDMDDDMAGDGSAPGSAVKSRKGGKSRPLYASAGAPPQPPIQPGATLTGTNLQSDRSESHSIFIVLTPGKALLLGTWQCIGFCSQHSGSM